MSWRGGRGGRGRGRGGYGGAGYVKAEPFEIYPDIMLPDRKSISIDSELVKSDFRFHCFWSNSPYHFGDGVSKKENESLDIERFSDSLKRKRRSYNKGSFYDFLVLRPDNFPKELLGETRRERPAKRAKWSQEAYLQKLDVFEKLEAKAKAEGKKEKKKEEEEEEDEDEDEENASDGEDYDNGDYDQNQDFDDDDDDYNQADEGGAEEVL